MKKSSKAMQKSVLNFSINATMTLCMSAIIGIGFLMKYTLVSGQKRWEIYGRNVELNLLGMDRHQWGMLHLILAFVLLGLLVAHIILHWKVITNVYRKIIKEPLTKKAIAIVFVILCALLIVIPFFVKPDVETIKKRKRTASNICYRNQVTLVTDIYNLGN